MQSSNPAFTAQPFTQFAWADRRSAVMTVQGTVAKTALLLAILTGTAVWSWDRASHGALNPTILIGSAIGGFVVALLTIFRPTVSPYTAPLYAGLEGVFLGALSFLVEQRYYKGIAMQATTLTLATLLVMLFLYGTRLIRVTEKLKAGIMMMTGAIALVYFISFLVNMFGGHFPYIHEAGKVGIGFSIFVVGLAAFNLLIDFDFIERGAQSDAPKFMEWYGAFGLIVTLVWLYLEILRLLRKLYDSDRR